MDPRLSKAQNSSTRGQLMLRMEDDLMVQGPQERVSRGQGSPHPVEDESTAKGSFDDCKVSKMEEHQALCALCAESGQA